MNLEILSTTVTSTDEDGASNVLHVVRLRDRVIDMVIDGPEILRELRNHFSTRCRHAHDCCGNVYGTAFAAHVAGDVFTVFVLSYRNI